MIHVGNKIVALRGIARLSVGAHVVFDSATSGGGGGGGGGGALAVSLDPDPVSGGTARPDTLSITTQQCTATPSGGTPPYSYAWVQTDDALGWSIISPTSQATKFRGSGVSPGSDSSATFEVTVTDARGRTATAEVGATVTNYGDLTGGVSA